MKTIIILFYLFLTLSLNAKVNIEEKPYRVGDRFHTLEFDEVTEWPSLEVLQERFLELRDMRVLSYEGKSRKLPWFFLRDGCHLRSTILSYESEKRGYGLLKVMYLHGDLVFKSPYIPGGSLGPLRFHAAAVVKVKGQVYVLDPSSDYDKPLTLKNWALTFSESVDNDLFSICSPHTYLTSKSCFEQTPVTEEVLKADSEYLLKREENILKNFGFDVEELLFNN